MSRGLGPLQLKLLAALRAHGQEASLEVLASFAASLIPDLGARLPYGRAPSRAKYVATARAVATLCRRGLVETETYGTTRGVIEWYRDECGVVRPKWRFRNPTKRVMVTYSLPE